MVLTRYFALLSAMLVAYLCCSDHYLTTPQFAFRATLDFSSLAGPSFTPLLLQREPLLLCLKYETLSP
jgi:hypothetical protein